MLDSVAVEQSAQCVAHRTSAKMQGVGLTAQMAQGPRQNNPASARLVSDRPATQLVFGENISTDELRSIVGFSVRVRMFFTA